MTEKPNPRSTANTHVQEPFVHHATPGDLWWAMSKTAPYVHQVCLLPENPHSSIFFAMEIIRPPPPGLSNVSPIQHPCYRLRPEDSRPGNARVYDFRLEPGASTGPHSMSFMGVILCLAIGAEGGLESIAGGTGSGGQGGTPKKRDLFEDGSLSRVGGWKWIEGGEEVNVRNSSDGTYQAIVVEWLAEGQAVESTAKL